MCVKRDADGLVSCWGRRRSDSVQWRWKDTQSTSNMCSRVMMPRSQSRSDI